MVHFTDIAALAGVLIAIQLIILRCIFFLLPQFKSRAVLVGVMLIVALLPFGTLSVAGWVRGITGDLSVTTLVLMCVALYANLSHRTVSRDQVSTASVLTLVVIFAFALYPCALGIGMFDPYRLGFGNFWFVGGLLLLALVAWNQRYTLVALTLSLAVLAWSVGWYESNNLWDYLLDPWVLIYALGALLKLGMSKWRRKVI